MFAPDTVISHYKIIRKIGAGGMGEVYLAEDTRLNRRVALKFLPVQYAEDKGLKARFKREAQAAAALNHPNVITIHEVAEHESRPYIAMEYVEGRSLKDLIVVQRLPVEKVIDFAVQICEGLAKAHQSEIVHRDVKPQNIMIDRDGRVRICDFGLARVKRDVMLTQLGTTVGTVAYMSPEQARGEDVDCRTDIWALGVVIYEMLAGELPFKGEHDQAVIYSILNAEPRPLTGLPVELERVVNRALAKNPEERYQTASEALEDLRLMKEGFDSGTSSVLVTRTQASPSIAVLPFANLSADKEQEYFCDGMAEEIINALTQVEGLHVVARTSAFSFRDRKVDVREIGRRLNVKAVLEGSVRKAGSKLRITAQLVSVADGYHLWSERYDRDIGALCCPEDIFAIQDEISLAIVGKLKVKLLGGERTKILKRHTHDLDAYNLYLKGRYFWDKRTEENLNKGIEYFSQAVEKDPEYALAYVGLADSYVALVDYSFLSPKELFVKAREAATRALGIDPMLAEAHNSMAQVMFREWNWEGAEKEHKRAIELNPDYPNAHHWYALFLTYAGRFDEAIAGMKKAWELDPLSLIINRNLGLFLYYARRYDQALEQLQKTVEMDPNFSMVHAAMGEVYLQKSMYEEALREFQKEADIHGRLNQHEEAWRGIAYLKAGNRDEARRILDDLLERSEQAYVAPTRLAGLYFALGENDEGFRWLDKSYQEHDSTLLEIKVDPGFDGVRSDPRFEELLKKVGLDK
jgi:TolB-like protein/Tfp pilus assembly protein PilF/predicted Ser/Thr protein kinase